MEVIPFTRGDAASLKEQEKEFTNEGAPPPGVVGTDLPVGLLNGSDKVPACGVVPGGVAERGSMASLERRVRVAEEERDALATFTQEEPYLRASSRVAELERRLEERTVESPKDAAASRRAIR